MRAMRSISPGVMSRHTIGDIEMPSDATRTWFSSSNWLTGS